METAMPQSPQFRHRVDPSGCILSGGICRDGKNLDGADEFRAFRDGDPVDRLETYLILSLCRDSVNDVFALIVGIDYLNLSSGSGLCSEVDSHE